MKPKIFEIAFDFPHYDFTSLFSNFRRIICQFRSSHSWFSVTFGDEVMKIRKYYVIFVYILQGKKGKTEKKQKENHATKVTKIPKTKRRKYGMNET